MSSRGAYNADPALKDRPLRVDEVEALIMGGGKQFSRSDENVMHLLHRMAATLRDQRSRMTAMSQDVERIKVEKETRSHPMAKAVEALSALTDDQRRQLLDSSYMAEMDKLKRAQEELDLARTAALNEINRVRFALATLVEDEEIPPPVRQKILTTVNKIPAVRPPGA